MGVPYLGEIRLTSFAFAPKGWTMCNGQILPIAQNQALFSILGTTYGGNGQTTFQLPNLQGRVAMHFGAGTSLGQIGGAESVTITSAQLPAHTHALPVSSSPAQQTGPANAVPALTDDPHYRAGSGNAILNPATLSAVGGGQPHTNLQPYLVLNFIIALQGVFPSRN